MESYLYDGMGALFARGTTVAPVSVSQFQYDLDGKLLEEDLNNAAQADYIYLNDRPVAVYDPTHGTFSYLSDDRLGTPVKATSSAAATVWSASYNPFGLIYAQSGSIVQNLRLPGQFADPITGRYHNGWRDYNPAIGRYEEVDPLNRLAGWNVFGYADQNPLKNIDPSGLSTLEFNRKDDTLTLKDDSGNTVGVFPAGNNAQRSSNGPFPDGSYDLAYHKDHPGDSDSTYGSYGIYVFSVPDRPGIGVHSGRANSTDRAGRSGTNFATNGCIRTTDTAMSTIQNQIENGDPLKTLTVH